ncbi:hypothetical protein FKR81_21800 [Lentzea tibetensis]|uniref:Uncharacterized protein n=1 Tax=Lentzea tibetensis TaxID=2591470 RepID=A0A563ERP6_9PSEU|nr:hypothetical protein [Lentzea tibetensis]TWP50330.1 hypothetical protein FKR81_21800 [Lentzea tibetensis]
MVSIWLLRIAAAATLVFAACGGDENPVLPVVPPSYTLTVSGTTVVVTDLITKSITAELQAEVERRCVSQSGVPLGADCLGDLVPQIGALPNCAPASGRCLELALKNNGSVGILRVREQTPGGSACSTGRLCGGVEILADAVKSAGKKAPTSSSAPSSTSKPTSKTQVTTTTKPSK